jgi:hypothetical protein
MDIRKPKSLITIAVAAASLSIGGCERSVAANPIVGVWLVHDGGAPFPMHMYVFNADGTMQQANPDAGDAHGSDSDGKGVWEASGHEHVRGKWVEVMADRDTHRFTGRGEYSFEIAVSGDRLNGSGTMRLFDAKNLPVGTNPTTFTGERVTVGR